MTTEVKAALLPIFTVDRANDTDIAEFVFVSGKIIPVFVAVNFAGLFNEALQGMTQSIACLFMLTDGAAMTCQVAVWTLVEAAMPGAPYAYGQNSRLISHC